jgi:hypothetical protein
VVRNSWMDVRKAALWATRPCLMRGPLANIDKLGTGLDCGFQILCCLSLSLSHTLAINISHRSINISPLGTSFGGGPVALFFVHFLQPSQLLEVLRKWTIAVLAQVEFILPRSSWLRMFL